MKSWELTKKDFGSTISVDGEIGVLDSTGWGATNKGVFYLGLLDKPTLTLTGEEEVEILVKAVAPTNWGAVIEVDGEHLSYTGESTRYPWINLWGTDFTVGDVNRRIADAKSYRVLFEGVQV